MFNQRSSRRKDSKPAEEDTKGRGKRWIFAIDSDQKQSASHAIEAGHYKGKKFSGIKRQEGKQIKPGDVLYLYLHGAPPRCDFYKAHIEDYDQFFQLALEERKKMFPIVFFDDHEQAIKLFVADEKQEAAEINIESLGENIKTDLHNVISSNHQKEKFSFIGIDLEDVDNPDLPKGRILGSLIKAGHNLHEDDKHERMWVDLNNNGKKTVKTTAKEFLNWIVDKKQLLTQDVHHLKIFACHSNEFAKEVWQLAKDEFPNLNVYGYEGEVVARTDGPKLANLKPPLIDISSRGHPLIKAEIQKPGVESKHRASKNRVVFGPLTLQKEHENREEQQNTKRIKLEEKGKEESTFASQLGSLSSELEQGQDGLAQGKSSPPTMLNQFGIQITSTTLQSTDRPSSPPHLDTIYSKPMTKDKAEERAEACQSWIAEFQKNHDTQFTIEKTYANNEWKIKFTSSNQAGKNMAGDIIADFNKRDKFVM
jgi:hypothetical protein